MKNKVLVLILILILCGCESNYSTQDTREKCGMEYTQGCGFDYEKGENHCGYGYFRICREVENEKDN